MTRVWSLVTKSVDGVPDSKPSASCHAGLPESKGSIDEIGRIWCKNALFLDFILLMEQCCGEIQNAAGISGSGREVL